MPVPFRSRLPLALALVLAIPSTTALARFLTPARQEPGAKLELDSLAWLAGHVTQDGIF